MHIHLFRGNRRQFLKLTGLSFLATQLPAVAQGSPPFPVKPPRLQVGDTIGLVSAASLIDAEDLAFATGFLTNLGFQVKTSPHILAEYGYLAGTDQQRATDLNGMFADDQVKGILATRGGWGSGRILPLLDYD